MAKDRGVQRGIDGLSVDSSHGFERKIIILYIQFERDDRPGLLGDMHHLLEAVTRAKQALIIIMDVATIESRWPWDRNRNFSLTRLVGEAKRNGMIKEINRVVESFDVHVNCMLIGRNRDQLLRDFADDMSRRQVVRDET
jgi:hypothetical protein